MDFRVKFGAHFSLSTYFSFVTIFDKVFDAFTTTFDYKIVGDDAPVCLFAVIDTEVILHRNYALPGLLNISLIWLDYFLLRRDLNPVLLGLFLGQFYSFLL